MAYQILKHQHPDVNGRSKKGFMKHPSMDNPTYSIHLSEILKWRDRILALSHMPMTYQNFEKILELKKGYKSTNDVDFGMNGPDNDKTAGILSGQVLPKYG